MGSEAFHLQQITENYRHQAKVPAVTSGKGGVGKTNMAANLAICPAASWKKAAEGEKTYQRIANAVTRFLDTHMYDAGVILRDERLTSAVRLRKPVVLAYPKAQSTSSLVALAAKRGNGLAAQLNNESFFNKVVGCFF